jgi:hypothetical protein
MEPELHTGLVAAQGKFGTSAAAAVFRSRPLSETSAMTKPNVLGKGGFEAAFCFPEHHHICLNRRVRSITPV